MKRTKKKPKKRDYIGGFSRVLNLLVKNVLAIFRCVAFYALIFFVALMVAGNVDVHYKGHRIKENLRDSLKDYALTQVFENAIGFLGI